MPGLMEVWMLERKHMSPLRRQEGEWMGEKEYNGTAPGSISDFSYKSER